MSDVAFDNEADDTADDQVLDNDEAAEEDEDDLEAGAEEEEAKPAKDWEKIAHDREGAVAKERSRRKAESARARELEARLERLEGERKPAGEADAMLTLIESLRDDDDDPITDIATVKKALKTFMDQQKADRARDSETAQQHRQIQSLVSTMEDHEADFTDDHPDYPKAAAHYKQARRDELEEMGYSGAQLQQALAQDLLGLASRAIQSGRDPAEAVYKLAQKRGFTAGASEATAADKLRKIADSAAAGRTPSGAKPAAGRLTYASVSTLKGAAFDAGMAKLREQERRAG